MNSLTRWKLKLGCFQGTQISISFVFLIFILLTTISSTQIEDPPAISFVITGILIWLLSVALHELTHLWMGAKFHSEIDEVILWPLGGLKPVEPEGWEFDATHYARDFIKILTAPLIMHLILVVVSSIAIIMLGVETSLLFQFFAPPVSESDSVLIQVLGFTYWINLGLLLINCIPAFPLDGYYVCLSLIALKTDRETATARTSFIAKIAAVMMIVTAILLPEEYRFATISLVMFGILTLILEVSNSKKQAQGYANPQEQDSFMGYDFSEGYTSLERENQATEVREKSPKKGMFSNWTSSRKEQKQRKQEEQHAQDQEKLDTILEKISTTGMESLSSSEKKFLDQMSKKMKDKNA